MAQQSQSSAFQVPPEMRAFAEQSVVQAKQAFDSVVSAAKGTMSSLEGQAAAAHAGVRDVQRKAIAFAEQNVDASFDFARRLLAAKTGEDVAKIQAEFLRSQIETFGEQTRELGVAVTGAARGAAESKTESKKKD
jgi:phasin